MSRDAGRRAASRPPAPLPPSGRLPVVALVGRPNVGKSTLFNRLIGARRAIVEDEPGVTRDRNYAEAVLDGRRVLVVDTGGFDPDAEGGLWQLMREQVEVAIEEADVVVWMVDARDGVNPTDESIGRLLLDRHGALIVAVNKADTPVLEMDGVAEAFRVGADDPIPIAAEHRRNLSKLRKRIAALLPDDAPLAAAADEETRTLALDDDERAWMDDGDISDRAALEEIVRASAHRPADTTTLDPERAVSVAIVGKPNAGKSTLVNRLIGSDRHLTSDRPGTTRDSIDSWLLGGTRPYLLIDTAGLRRKARISDRVERYSAIRALESIRRADVALLIIDAVEGLTEQDKRIARLIAQYGKGAAILVNKWDAVEKDHRTADAFADALRADLPFFDWAPILFLSALSGKRAHKVTDLIETIAVNRSRRVSTGILNRALATVVARHQPPVQGTRRPRLFFGVQQATEPPTFLVFASYAAALPVSYRRFMVHNLRQMADFTGSPVRLHIRERKRSASKKDRGPKREKKKR